MRRVGVFTPGTADDPEHKVRDAAFLQGMGELGWIVGRNLRVDYRWGAGDYERFRAMAAELIALAPDVILAQGSSTVTALQKTSTHGADRVRQRHRSGRRRPGSELGPTGG